MATVTVHCPRCHSDEVYRHGRSCSRHERFRCRSCKRVFQLTYSYEARKPGIKEQIVEMAHNTHETRRFARELNLEPCTTAVSSPQSNGMAERFVKTMKEDYNRVHAKTGCGNSPAKPCSSVHALQ